MKKYEMFFNILFKYQINMKNLIIQKQNWHNGNKTSI